MANAATTPSATSAAIGWRTPVVILLCGCLISLVSFGPRATLGFFLTPQSQANGWGRDVFAFALALPIVEQPVQRLTPATAG